MPVACARPTLTRPPPPLPPQVWNEFMQLYGGGPTIRRARISIYDMSPAPSMHGHARVDDGGDADTDDAMAGDGSVDGGGHQGHGQSQPMHYDYSTEGDGDHAAAQSGRGEPDVAYAHGDGDEVVAGATGDDGYQHHDAHAS